MDNEIVNTKHKQFPYYPVINHHSLYCMSDTINSSDKILMFYVEFLE